MLKYVCTNYNTKPKKVNISVFWRDVLFPYRYTSELFLSSLNESLDPKYPYLDQV